VLPRSRIFFFFLTVKSIKIFIVETKIAKRKNKIEKKP
jgi:hypothetical protein